MKRDRLKLVRQPRCLGYADAYLHLAQCRFDVDKCALPVFAGELVVVEHHFQQCCAPAGGVGCHPLVQVTCFTFGQSSGEEFWFPAYVEDEWGQCFFYLYYGRDLKQYTIFIKNLILLS